MKIKDFDRNIYIPASPETFMVQIKKEIKDDSEKHSHGIKIHPVYAAKKTLGQEAADKLTTWAGSWIFIFFFLIIVAVWIYANTLYLINYGEKPFDPYPFILLNLALSLLAALQAPVILMSQNRQSEINRRRSEYDYSINRKAAREINEMRKILSRVYSNKLEKRKGKK